MFRLVSLDRDTITGSSPLRGIVCLFIGRGDAACRDEQKFSLPAPMHLTPQAVATPRARLTNAAIDVLVNNAGFGLMGAVDEATLAKTRRLYETDALTTTHPRPVRSVSWRPH
jgi:NAD(P)-dependent dehydrogenase (short-subunit alcohol dehydrogenase family)